MRRNCEQFNGVQNEIAVLARMLEETAKEVVESNVMQEQINLAREKM